jgi:hypothetical protein
VEALEALMRSLQAAELILKYREKQELYKGESFQTIAGEQSQSMQLGMYSCGVLLILCWSRARLRP